MKCRADAVATARTSAHSATLRQRPSNLMAATLPEAARRTRGRRGGPPPDDAGSWWAAIAVANVEGEKCTTEARPTSGT